MKKFTLTLMAVAFGMGVSFAQTAPLEDLDESLDESENTVHALVFDRMVNKVVEEEASRRSISVYALPEMVLEQLKHSELGGHAVISVMEVQTLADNNESLQYELVLQDGPDEAAAEPKLVVRFDEFGEIISQKEVPALAQQEK